MSTLIVLENPRRWNLDIPGVEVVPAKRYLIDREFSERKGAKVYNFCRAYSYQSVGYYVSLLAVARGHRPLPSVATIHDLRSAPIVRIASDEMESLIQSSLSQLKSDRFTLSVYFGANVAGRYDRISRALFNQFPAPFLRAEFVRTDRWRLEHLRTIAANDVPQGHEDFVIERAKEYFARSRSPGRVRRTLRWDLAILADPNELDSPSDSTAIKRFIKAGRTVGIDSWVIEKDDYGSIAEYDALFIRETTAVNHHTYRFARRAAFEGLVVVDDPESIIRCTNKVYLAESFARYGIPTPDTMVVHRDNVDEVAERIGFPCVLKRPDSSFSLGVVKAEDRAELEGHLRDIFRESELAVAQKFVPSDFDWRIGVLGGAPLFCCKYYMASGHWQIQKNESGGKRTYGKVDTLPIADAPRSAVAKAVKAARIIGDGFYGVDIKQVGRHFYVMEVNDNPNVESGVEDVVLGAGLYERIMGYFRDRLERR